MSVYGTLVAIGVQHAGPALRRPGFAACPRTHRTMDVPAAHRNQLGTARVQLHGATVDDYIDDRWRRCSSARDGAARYPSYMNSTGVGRTPASVSPGPPATPATNPRLCIPPRAYLQGRPRPRRRSTSFQPARTRAPAQHAPAALPFPSLKLPPEVGLVRRTVPWKHAVPPLAQPRCVQPPSGRWEAPEAVNTTRVPADSTLACAVHTKLRARDTCPSSIRIRCRIMREPTPGTGPGSASRGVACATPTAFRSALRIRVPLARQPPARSSCTHTYSSSARIRHQDVPARPGLALRTHCVTKARADITCHRHTVPFLAAALLPRRDSLQDPGAFDAVFVAEGTARDGILDASGRRAHCGAQGASVDRRAAVSDAPTQPRHTHPQAIMPIYAPLRRRRMMTRAARSAGVSRRAPAVKAVERVWRGAARVAIAPANEVPPK
ncbi:hypothetical protein WOLCODRAFT_155303 [Wolfiporia cocos MD-104 SS10]|uniref:Uncharacterized protein n=1 Tax=Wolfiporia cocos (strain MD-104) TaxID=742152 RepID=A0A2H3IY39_WOLCO|nr:hypothetical protein WOLCODRAFT_155303 [Wolfiporia cocos MD-104 SS10]